MHQYFPSQQHTKRIPFSFLICQLLLLLQKNIKEKLKEIVKLFYHHTKHEGFYLAYFRSATEWLHASIVMFMTLFCVSFKLL